MDTDKAILYAAVFTTGSTVAASVLPDKYGGQGSLPSARLLIGTSITFLGLSALGDVAPKVATGLAWSIAVTALTYYGFPVAGKYFNPTPPPTKRRK